MRGRNCSLFRLTISATLIATSLGCSDTVAPDTQQLISPGAAASLARMGASWQVRGGEPFACFLSVKAASGPIPYLYHTTTVDLPRGALSRDGSVVAFRYRLLSVDGDTLRFANCVVPGTERAIAVLRRKLDIPRAAEIQTSGPVI